MYNCDMERKERCKAWYRRNVDRERERARKHRIAWTAELEAIKIDRGCSRCGFKDHPAALHFHHQDDKLKTFNISNSTHSKERKYQEISKCIILCANCHAIEHYKLDHPGIDVL
jgi:hypothetical protein